MLRNRFILVAALVIICLLTVSCDAGLEIISATIDRYPDRIVYFSGDDEKLDLSGGQITLHLRDGEVKSYQMDDELVVVEHNINFDVPGVYTVTLSGPLSFPVQVVDQDFVDAYLK